MRFLWCSEEDVNEGLNTFINLQSTEAPEETMNIKRTTTAFGLVISTVLAVANSAQASTFKTNVDQSNGVKGDTWLKSVEQKGQTIDNFVLVNKADILSNTAITKSNPGGASTDKGDNASAPVKPAEDPTGAQVAAYMNNNNLSNIVDTEDTGSFTMNLFFKDLIQEDSQGLDNLFFWERGMNSDLGIQAINSIGELIGQSLKLDRSAQANAGFSIDTTEIGEAQKVGSWGVSLKQLGVTALSGIQVTANGSLYNGPDFKVVARKTAVPEPATVMGLVVVGGALGLLRRRQVSQVS